MSERGTQLGRAIACALANQQLTPVQAGDIVVYYSNIEDKVKDLEAENQRLKGFQSQVQTNNNDIEQFKHVIAELYDLAVGHTDKCDEYALAIGKELADKRIKQKEDKE